MQLRSSVAACALLCACGAGGGGAGEGSAGSGGSEPSGGLAGTVGAVAAGGGGAGGGSPSGGAGGGSSDGKSGDNGPRGSVDALSTERMDAGAAAAADGGQHDAGGVPGAKRKSSCPPGPFAAPMAGASQSVCSGFKFKYNWNEGPVWSTSQGAFFFTNFVIHASGPGDIIKYTPGGQCETFIANAGCNGLTIGGNGNLVGVCHTPRAVVEYDFATKQPKTLASMYMGKALDSPNDITVHSNGTLYFTNPTFELAGRPPGFGPAIFRIDSGGVLSLIVKLGGDPNGITISPDERRLYAVGGGVWDLDADAIPSNRRGFPLNADGMTVDCAGNIYMSSGPIVNPDGKPIGSIPSGTHPAFGGADGKSLMMVSGTGVKVIQMNVPGPIR